MATFKKGDKVLRVRDDHYLAKVGEVYTVAAVPYPLTLHLVGHYIRPGELYGYAPYSFEHATVLSEYRVRIVGKSTIGATLYATEYAAVEAVRTQGMFDVECEVLRVTPVKRVVARKSIEVLA